LAFGNALLHGKEMAKLKNTGAVLRCAIYTRKSSEEGLEQDFNSLQAQRAFVRSQKHEGWSLLSTKYDDGGYSGGTLQRPALERLLTDIRTTTARRRLLAVAGMTGPTSISR
jgi:hypothetical protein